MSRNSKKQWPNSGGHIEHGEYHPGWSKLVWRERIEQMARVAVNPRDREFYATWAEKLGSTQRVEPMCVTTRPVA